MRGVILTRMSTRRSELEQLVRDHQSAIYRYLRYLGAQASVAEDLVQETFLATMQENPHQPDHPDDPRWQSWLRGIARNLFLAECRRSSHQPIPMDDPALELAEEVWANSFNTETDWSNHLAALHQCIEKLPPRQREALTMRYAERTARQDMALQLEMSEEGVKTRLRRIRTALARCIQQRIKASGMS
jgi:RNA polymerase sigma-70 factor (ECF subfamily)